MKTSIELSEEKLELARKLAPQPTTRKLIDAALDAYIREARRGSLLSILGTDFFDGDLKKMRKSRGRNPS
jgi:hypothetical protein